MNKMSNHLAASIREGGGGGSRAPVRVIILAENHSSNECHAKNRKLVEELFEKHQVRKEATVFVSEGDRINPCYLRLGIQPSNMIIEFESSNKPTYHYLQSFILTFPTFESTISGEYSYIEEDFKHIGKLFLKMLRKIPEKAGITSYEKLIQVSLMNDMDAYRNELVHLCTLLNEHAFNDEAPEEKAFLSRLVLSIIESKGIFEYINIPGGPLDEIDERREKAVLDKMNLRVQADPTITTVVIIFGKAHYRNLERLLSKSQLFNMNKSLSNIKTEPWNTSNTENEGGHHPQRKQRKKTRKTRRRKLRK